MKKISLLLFLLILLLSGCTPRIYTVSFESNGGTFIESVTREEGQVLTQPEIPLREGYEFKGWYKDSLLNETYDFTTEVTSDLELYSKWQQISYELVQYLGYENNTESLYFTFEENLSITDPTREGYEFIGWYLEDTFETEFGYTTMPSSDIDIYAKWEIGTFEANIHLLGTDNYTLDFEYNETLTIIISVPEGYELEGLYQDEDYLVPFTTTNMPGNDIDIYVNLQLIDCEDGEVLLGGECVVVNDSAGRIDVLAWTGTGTYYEDMGHMNLTADDFVSSVEASFYAVAKSFNEMYPDVTINFLALVGGPTDGGRNWDQELQNYRNLFDFHPSIWWSNNLSGDVKKGIVADLSRFESDPLYQSLNPSIMSTMNYYGFQAGLPQYIIPWGIYVNKSLADNLNLDVPDFDWTIDEYTDFIGNSEENVFYGSMDTPLRIIETGTNDITKQMLYRTSMEDYVNLNSDEVRSLIPYIQEWYQHSVWGGNASDSFMGDHWWWSYKFFIENKLLTLEGDPWMLGDCASPDTSWSMRCKSDNWDIYPRPSTDFVDNTIGIVLDPMVVYNFCLDDGDLRCTDEEEAKIALSYSFASFYIADTSAWQARADMQFRNVESGGLAEALGDSFPVTTGSAFDEQMEIWYSTSRHQRFSDATLMPGFQEVVRIYQNGQFWDVSDKAYPYYHSSEGQSVFNLYEWKSYWNPAVNGGVERDDINYTDTILSNLSTWNDASNEHFQLAFEQLQNALKMFYGFTNQDFE